MRREKKTIGWGAYPSNRPALFLFGAVFTALFLVSSLISPLAAYAENFPGFTHTFSYDSPVGVGGGPSMEDNASLAFNAPLTSTSSILTPPRAYPGTAATFSRASAQYITDFEGVTRKVESGSVAVEGSRVVTNLLTYSEDLSNVAWSPSGTCTVTGTNTVNLPADGDLIGQTYGSSSVKLVAGSVWSYSAVLSGTGTVQLRINGLTGGSATLTLTLSSTPTRFVLKWTVAVDNSGASFRIRRSGTTATSVTVHSAQLENVTGQSNQKPGEYVKTTSAAVTKCFATTNGNTVDANGVVTEATGTALPQSYSERQNSTAYALNDKIQVSGWWYNCTTAGTSASSAPTFPTGKAGSQTVTDGTAVWTIGGRLLLGYVSEPAITNKVTAYGIIPADTLGSELITVESDRTFASDTGFWTKGTGWTIGSGLMNFDGTGSDISFYRAGVITAGKYYDVTYTITGRTQGTFRVLGGGAFGDEKSVDGTYTTRLFPTTTSSTLYFQARSNFIGSIDNVSIKEVTWAVGTKSFHNGSSFVQNISGLTLSGDTAAVLSIVTDEAEIEKVGLAGINPGFKVYKLDNSAGTGAAYAIVAGTPGNTNPHSSISYIRHSGTNNKFRLESQSVSGLTASSVYLKYANLNITPAGTGSRVLFEANAGSIVYFLLPQLEELPYATSIMPTSGATATRAATVLSYPVSGNLSSPLWSAKITATPAAASQDGKFFLGSYLDANNSVGLLMSGANAVARKRIGGSNNDATKALTLVAGTTKRFGMRGSSSGWSLFVDGVKGTDSANTTTPVAGTSFQLGLDGNSGNAFYGYLRDFYLYNKPLADGRF